MNSHGERQRHRRMIPGVQTLDARRLLSGGIAHGLVANPTGRYLTVLGPAATTQSAISAHLRIFTPEAWQAARSRAGLVPGGAAAASRQNPLRFRTLPSAIPAGQALSGGEARVADGRHAKTTPTKAGTAIAISADPAAMIQEIVDLTNQARVQSQSTPLASNPSLMLAASLHSQDMARVDRMLHDIPGSPVASLTDRAAQVHYRYQILGENIAYNQADAPGVVAAWLNSPPHRQNMLNPAFTEIGVGIAWNPRGEPYYTMDLGKSA